MSTYAELKNGVVVNIIEAAPEFIASLEGTYVESIQVPEQNTAASIGSTYDPVSKTFSNPNASCEI